MKYISMALTFTAGLIVAAVFIALQYEQPKGSDGDYGLYKQGQKDHVITVHGFYENKAVCSEIAETFTADGPAAYTCLPL
jgi:hypothetical protein